MQFEVLKKSDYEEWDAFVDSSPQGSIFSKSWYLQALNFPFKIMVIKKNNHIECGTILIKNKLHFYSNPLLVKYLGILSKNSDGNLYQKQSFEKQSSESLMAAFQKHQTYNYSFHPNFTNWLPFYWSGFKCTTKYTYVIKDIKNKESFMNNISSARKRDFKIAQKNNPEIIHDFNVNDCYFMIKKTFNRQGGAHPFYFCLF